MRNIVAVLLLLLAMPAQAAPEVVVQGIQMPAWLQRGTNTRPLSPGMELSNGDIQQVFNDYPALIRSQLHERCE